MKGNRLLFLLFILCPTIRAAAAPGDREVEKQRLFENVIAAGGNLYGDAIPISAPARTLRKAWKELRELDDSALANYSAAFYIFPQGDKPIALYGALVPAGEGLDDIHRAAMHVRVTARDMVRLRELPASTIVYGVDGSGSKAWFPLRFFEAHSIHPGYISSEGFYAYSYRPTARLLGRYGRRAYYLDLLQPEQWEQARLDLEDNIRLLGSDVPDNVARVAWFSRAAFYGPLLRYFDLTPELARIGCPITIYSGEQGGTIDVRIPFRVHYSNNGERYTIWAHEAMFEGLEAFRSTVADRLEEEGDDTAAARVRGYGLTVSHTTDAGIARFSRRAGAPGDEPVTELTIYDAGNVIIYSHSTPGRQVMARPDETLAGFLGQKGIEGEMPEPGKGTDWKEFFDTAGYGTGDAAASRPPGGSDKVLASAFGFYELDVQPTFRGGDFSSFCSWLYDSITEMKLSSGDDYYEMTSLEFVIDETGSLIYIREVDSTWGLLLASIVNLMEQSKDDWTPGEIAGIPVRVRYRIDVTI